MVRCGSEVGVLTRKVLGSSSSTASVCVCVCVCVCVLLHALTFFLSYSKGSILCTLFFILYFIVFFILYFIVRLCIA
jgi:hypothetical protein